MAHAKVVAGALADGFAESAVPWSRVHPRPPHTHQFQVWLPYAPDVLDEASVRQAEETGTTLFRRWFPAPAGPPGLSFTEVTVAAPGLEWTAGDVREAVADFAVRPRETAAARAQDGPVPGDVGSQGLSGDL